MDADFRATNPPAPVEFSVPANAAKPAAHLDLGAVDFRAGREVILAQAQGTQTHGAEKAVAARASRNAQSLFYSLVSELSGVPLSTVSDPRAEKGPIITTNAPATMPTAADALLAQAGVRLPHQHKTSRDSARYAEFTAAFDAGAGTWSTELSVTPPITSLKSGLERLNAQREEYLRLNPSKRSDLEPHKGKPNW